MNLRQERLLSRRSQLGRERFKCWNAWCSWHRQRHERGRYRCVALSLFTDPAVHHVRVQAMRQGHTTDAGPRLGTQGKYLCLELLAVFTPAWAVLIQRLFHRLHDPPSWGRCPLQAVLSRWDRQLHTVARISTQVFVAALFGIGALDDHRIKHRLDLRHIVHVGTGDHQRQRGATPVHQQVALAPIFFPDPSGWALQLLVPAVP